MRRSRSASAGLLTAARNAKLLPVEMLPLFVVKANNAGALFEVLKIVFCLANGTPGTTFFLGSVSLAAVLGVHQRTAHRWVRQLEALGVIRRTWTGGQVAKDFFGRELPKGTKLDRASEFVFVGLPRQLGDAKQNCLPVS